MSIEKCNYKSDGDSCDACEKVIKKGCNVYFEKTSYEYDEGDTYCYTCKIKAEKSQKEFYEQFSKDHPHHP